MQFFRGLEQEDATPVGFGTHVMLVSAAEPGNVISRRLAGLGGVVDQRAELFCALDELIEGPRDFGLVVIDCDTLGGLAQGRRAVGLLGEIVRAVPVILVSSECSHQRFPEDRLGATELRAPLSAISMRVGFEHALRDRFAVNGLQGFARVA